jgi:PEP-CTERM motif
MFSFSQSAVKAAVAVAVATAGLASVGAAQAAVVLDQNSLVTPTPQTPAPFVARTGTYALPIAGMQVVTPVIYAQTITAGKSGTLDRIEMQIAQGSGTGFLNIGLYAGDWTQNPLAQEIDFIGTFSGQLPTLTEALAQTRLFTFSTAGAGYRVNPGSVFSLVFQYQPFADTGWANLLIGSGSPFVPGQTPTFNLNQYAGGTLSRYEFRQTGVVGPTAGPADVGFRTYVDTAGVPEPATWAILILGFGLIGGAMRSRTAPANHRSTPLTLPHVRAAV